MVLRKLGLFTFLLATAAFLAFAAADTLNVQIKEYDVPTANSRPHDPALAPDGSLWYTGQGANKLGRLDPLTGKFKKYTFKNTTFPPRPTARRAHTEKRVKSRNIAHPAARRSTRTRLYSTTTASCGSPTKKPTTSVGSIRKPAR